MEETFIYLICWKYSEFMCTLNFERLYLMTSEYFIWFYIPILHGSIQIVTWGKVKIVLIPQK
jgi:hypothetical protein